MFSKRSKAKTTTISSVVTEQVEDWIKARAKKEGVTTSLWLANLLSYSMMTDAVTKGELSNIIHEIFHISDLDKVKKKFNMNPWSRSADYPVSRVRKGLQLYLRGRNVPDKLNSGLVTVLTNTSDGSDMSVYDPLSDSQVLEALRALEKNGEVKIVGDMVQIIDINEEKN